MEHWFDTLSRPRTRRSALKAAAGAGAALLLPAIRVPSASATPAEPCFKPCNDAAKVAWNNAKNGQGPGGCADVIQAGSLALTLSGAVGEGGAVALVRVAAWSNCLDRAELTGHRALIACRGSECGDPTKYPGGTVVKPPPNCDPTQEIRCGDSCCNNVDKCCQCQADGAYICCSAGALCEPTPDRGGCCVGH